MVDTPMMGWYKGPQKENGWDDLFTLEQGAAMPLHAALQPNLRSGTYWADFEEDKYCTDPNTTKKLVRATASVACVFGGMT